MKKILLAFIVTFIFVALLQAQEIKGDTLSVEGKKILKVWGDHYERGYATGYFVGDKIKYLSEEYFISSFFMNSPGLYNSTMTFFQDNFDIEEKYIQEAQGIIDGMIEAGIDLFDNVLQRDMDADDILMTNALVDLAAFADLNGDLEFGCSSISSWNESTLLDPELNGSLVHTRNMDWTPHPALMENHLLVVQVPSETSEVNWISFTFPGFFGSLSGINEYGLCGFMNMGNNDFTTNTTDLHPVLLSVRNGIENYDFNGDYEINADDVADAVSENNHLSGSIIHSANDSYALVIETNNENGTEVRDDTENTAIPANHLVATNHFRKLYSPVYCYRYNNIADSLSANSNMTIKRSWDVLGAAAGVAHNLHTIEFIPSLNQIKWSTATIDSAAYLREPTVFNMDDLFELPTSVKEEYYLKPSIVKSFPNPFFNSVSLSFSLSDPVYVELSVYNVKGQIIRRLSNEDMGIGEHTLFWDGKDKSGDSVVSGIYFYKYITDEVQETGRLLLVK